MKMTPIVRYLKTLWKFFKRKDFLISFVATMLGVLAAFWVNDLWHQYCKDQTTKHRLHLVILESQYNGTIALEALEVYSNTNSVTMFIKHVDTTAARIAFEDDNLFRFLPPYKVSLIKSYIESMNILNQSLDIYIDYLSSYKFNKGPQQDEILSTVRNNCAAALAICILLRENLNDYFDPDEYQHDQIRRVEERLKAISQKALRGEVKSSKIP